MKKIDANAQLQDPSSFFEIEDRVRLNFQNNHSFDCSILSDQTNIELYLSECGYERCDPYHYWGYGCKQVFVMHLILSGKGTLILNHRVFHPKTGQVFLLRPDDMVYYVADAYEPWEYRWVSFGGTKAPGIVMNTEFSQSPLQEARDVAALGRLILDIKESADDELSQIGRLYLFLSHVARTYPATDAAKPDYRTAEFHKILRFVNQNFGSKALVNDVASRFGYNRSHMYKLFMRYIGMSPKQYVLTLQMNIACEYIRSDSFPLETVSKKLGFADYPTFYRNFKNIVGQSPTDYAELCRTKTKPATDI